MTASADARPHRVTIDEFAALDEEEGYRLELSRGRLVREPAPGPRHGRLAFRVLDLLRRFGEDEGRGLVFFDTAFILSSVEHIVRVPDVAFVTADRIPPEGLSDGFWELAPDLVAEVVSPSNRASEMQQKALEYLEAGSRLVWLFDPAERTIAVYRSRSEIRILVPGEVLEAGNVLPELRVPVEGVFQELGADPS